MKLPGGGITPPPHVRARVNCHRRCAYRKCRQSLSMWHTIYLHTTCKVNLSRGRQCLTASEFRSLSSPAVLNELGSIFLVFKPFGRMLCLKPLDPGDQKTSKIPTLVPHQTEGIHRERLHWFVGIGIARNFFITFQPP